MLSLTIRCLSRPKNLSGPLYSLRSQKPFHSTAFTMVKPMSSVIDEFNEYVNMDVPELQQWLGTEGSTENCGIKKSDGSGETVGHESGRKIIDILKKNPDRDPDGYDEEDFAHMRKVVSYW
jgi:hypothetical protein